MTEAARLASLPGYDTAPDVYETPADLTDSTSATLLSASPRSASETDDTSEDEEAEERYGVSRRRLLPERARNRFGATSGRVEARGVNMSDRVDGGGRGYLVGGRGRREEEEEAVGLEERIARLRREVEECRFEIEREREEDDGEEGEGGEEGGVRREVDGLGRLLAGLDVPVRRERRREMGQARPGAINGAPIQSLEMGEEMSDEQTLKRVADFDTRLLALEHALGISSLDAATSDAVSTPVLPSLTLLDQQLSALTSVTSLTHLEAAHTRIQKLRHEAEQLSDTRATPATSDTVAATDDPTSLSQEDADKLQHLYTLLPTLQSLSPTVPALLARLRSLRTLHARAANAAEELEDVERRQAEMDNELGEWSAGLARVEVAVSQASEANGKNGLIVDGWVKDLEARVRGVR